MKYNPEWLQEEAKKLGSWNKVCKTHKISPKTIDSYKKIGLLKSVNESKETDLEEIQIMYDSGMSIRQICQELNIPHSLFSKKIIRRARKEARALVNHTFSEETLEKLSFLAKQKGLGGYRPHPNKGKRYKDVWFDSNWEVKLAISLDENHISWIRPKEGFVWTDKGNKYYPDFYLPEYDVYLDPKNDYLQIKDKVKIEEAQRINGIRVIVLSKNQLEWNVIAPIVQR